jgi:hypothetical protein
VASLTAFGGITGGTCIVHATLATGLLYRQGPEKNPVRNTVRCSGCRIPMSTRPKPTVENQPLSKSELQLTNKAQTGESQQTAAFGQRRCVRQRPTWVRSRRLSTARNIRFRDKPTRRTKTAVGQLAPLAFRQRISAVEAEIQIERLRAISVTLANPGRRPRGS